MGTSRMVRRPRSDGDMCLSSRRIYHSQGNYEEAEPLYKRALLIEEKAVGLEHPDLVGLLENYADLLQNLGHTTEADRLESQAELIRAKHAIESPTH